MKTLASLLLLCFCAGRCLGALEEESNEGRRTVTSNLVLDNAVDWGDWGVTEFCPEGSFAFAFELMWEASSLIDETALNAIKLYCSLPDGHVTGYITSTVGSQGVWMGMKVCDSGYLTGLRANVLPYQGTIFDDVAVEDVEMECNYGAQVVPGLPPAERFAVGTWSTWSKCGANSAVCGIHVRYETADVSDDAATTDISMFCCSV